MKVIVNRTYPRFHTLKWGHNARLPASAADEPDRILFCSSPEEIVQALRKVIATGLGPTVRSGGHLPPGLRQQQIPTVLSLRSFFPITVDSVVQCASWSVLEAMSPATDTVFFPAFTGLRQAGSLPSICSPWTARAPCWSKRRTALNRDFHDHVTIEDLTRPTVPLKSIPTLRRWSRV